MLRRIFAPLLTFGLLLALSGAVRADGDPRFAAEFVQGLRERGFYDLTLQYLDRLRQDPDTPPDLKKTLEFEEGRTLIDEATHAEDPDVSKVKLDQAKVKIEAFVKAYPELPQTTEALVDLAHLLYERGMTEVNLASEARAVNEKDAKLAGARGYYANAREAYSRAFERLNAKLTAYPKFIAPEDPKKIERERVRSSVMQSELQRSVVDYYEAQTYPPDAKERTELLDKALAAFEDIYKRYRVQMVGFSARMWQGKCYEEQGKLGEAMGIYNELMDHPDPALRPIQKQVDYFRIIVMSKRKEFALAADESVRWLKQFPKDRRSYEALGVQFELAKNILAQVSGLEGADRDKAVRTAADYLADVVRVVSPFKPEALALLQKHRPSAALNLADISKLSYDDAVAQAAQAISTLAYENAIALLKVAIRKSEPTRDAAKANSARYMLAYCFMMSKRYYEAAVLGEYVARRYPRGDWGAKSADLSMQALIEAYNSYTLGNRTIDLDRLVDLAKYSSESWPEAEQGDTGRMMLGLVSLGRGQYAEAIASFEAIRSASSKWIEAQTSCGDAYFKQSLLLREKGNTPEADADVQKAIDKLTLALKSRRDANAPDTDLGVVNNACDLAVIELETNKAAEALTLLDPIAKKLAATNNRSPAMNTAYSRVLASILRGHVSTGKVDLAIGDMKVLESIGGAGNSGAQLYFELGRLLEREIEALKKRNDQAGLRRTEDSYQKFLKALVASKTGQSFQSLRWAADNLLKLGSAKEANEVYTTLINTYGSDPDYLKTPNASEILTLVRLKQVAALRTMGNLADCEVLLKEIMDQNKRSIEPQMEMGYLLNAKAKAKDPKVKWSDCYTFWKTLATRLEKVSPKPVQFFEAWLQAAESLQKSGDTLLAKKTLATVMKLNPTLGGPETKAKYDQLMKQLGK